MPRLTFFAAPRLPLHWLRPSLYRRTSATTRRPSSGRAAMSAAAAPSTGGGGVLHWFRRALRVHDNPALIEAVRLAKAADSAGGGATAGAAAPLAMLYVLEHEAVTAPHTGAVRLRFLLESLTALDGELKKRAGGSGLRVLRADDGDVAAVVVAAAARWGATTLVFEDDDTPAGRKRDVAVEAAAAAAGLTVVTRSGHTLYPPAMLLEAAGGIAPRTMAAFTSLIDRVGAPLAPLPTVGDELPPPPPLGDGETAADVAVPTLGDLGWKADAAAGLRVPGGEAAALDRMEAFMARGGGAVVRTFEKPKTSMVAWRTPDTTVLSPYLAAGVLSPRTFHARLRAVEAAGNGRHTHPPVSLVGQLLWREHFHLLAGSVPNFDRMVGNPLCRQIPWDDPATDADAAGRHAAWAAAQTGYPAVDAFMQQLRTEGWVHHLGRHLLACFLTRGDLWVTWEAGAATFEELLLDWDPALNAGNWLWLSASAFFNSYYRVYGPVTWVKKADPEGKFIRHYLPVLARLPTQYIYEPWKAPASVQKAAGVRVGPGLDYPSPMVDHGVVSKINTDRMAKAFRSGAAAEKGGNKTPAVKVGARGDGAPAKPAASGGSSSSRGGRSAKTEAPAAAKPSREEGGGGAGGLRIRSGRVTKKS